MHRRAELQQRATDAGELGISGVKRVDRRGARKQDELGAQVDSFVVSRTDCLRCSRDLPHTQQLRAVPPELRGDRGAEELTRFRLEALGRDYKSLQWAGRDQTHD